MPLQPVLHEKHVSWMLAWNCIGPCFNTLARSVCLVVAPDEITLVAEDLKSRSTMAAGSRFVTSHNSPAGWDRLSLDLAIQLEQILAPLVRNIGRARAREAG
jgi:hypothetical protein